MKSTSHTNVRSAFHIQIQKSELISNNFISNHQFLNIINYFYIVLLPLDLYTFMDFVAKLELYYNFNKKKGTI